MAAFIQTLETIAVGQAGHIAASTRGGQGNTLVRVVDTNLNGALGVTNGATPGKTCKAPATEADVKSLLGILLDPEFKNEIGAAADYLAGQQATILEDGFVWVNAEKAVAVGDPVFCRVTSDGGSNTTPGTFRNDNDTPTGGIRITPSASPNAGLTGYLVRLKDSAGHDETFVFDTAASPTVNQIATGLASLINTSANFDAVDNTGSFNVTIQGGGAGQVEVLQLSEHLVATTPARAFRVEGAKFASATAGAGLAIVRLAAK